LFNLEILSSKNYDVPILSVGNITVGGTGKTPHTEYLIRILSKDYQVAVLSRGYKRKSRGFVLAGPNSNVEDLGDEPLQMKRKFPSLAVAVDENRRRGIETLTNPDMQPFIDVILLDDAFQHRYINPSISILLIDYNRLIREDFLLPVGNLREPAGQMKRANMVVVSKCPSDLKPMDIRILGTKIGISSYQTLYFTTMEYGSIVPVADESADRSISFEEIQQKQIPVLLLTGIAAPLPLENHIRRFTNQVKAMHFADHHEFGKRDVRKITMEFDKMREAGGIILTTEKDATRIRTNPLLQALVPDMYYPSLEIRFLDDQGKNFEQKITNYVRINKRNRKLS
jgi:tetraacyldisaccharide 4'-kinase